ncbi:MAG: ureidoglycolate lyase [Pseudomonadales bacterium]
MATKNSELRAEVLTQEAFSAFGDVIEVGDTKETRTINEGNTLRYHDLARLTLSSESGQPAISIFRSQPQTLPFEIKLMERHPLSSQAFFPLGTESYLVVVAPAGELKSDKIRAFIASGHQGVNYHPGTWHHYSLALNDISDFLVVDRIVLGDANADANCDEIFLDQPIAVNI